MFDKSFEYANLSNLAFIEKIYAEYKLDPSKVDPSWVYFFEGMELASSLAKVPFHKIEKSEKSSATRFLLEWFRFYGHLYANINPLKEAKELPIHIPLAYAGCDSSDLSKTVETKGLLDEDSLNISQIISKLQRIYASNIGIELLHLSDEKKEFITSYFEKGDLDLSPEQKLEVFTLLNQSELFESYIHLKHPGQKRFSLEGGESFIPSLHALIKQASNEGTKECVIGMAHRGRLNVLTNVMGKGYQDVFVEFTPGYIPPSSEGRGDVKYHKGYVCQFNAGSAKTVRLELCPNPSHLESVDPVLEGIVKAKQIKEKQSASILPIMIHGDASLAGQGVVYEVLQMSKIDGYSTDGTIHFVINNQIGFTANPSEARSTKYCTDIAKGFEIPIFHVNGDDPESCVKVARFAAMFRARFKCDVFIDILCYRKYGHSEGDEPFFTQPALYKVIQAKDNVRNLYKAQLIKEGVITEERASFIEKEFLALLESPSEKINNQSEPEKIKTLKSPEITESRLKAITSKFCEFPKELKVNSKIERLFQERKAMVEKAEAIDWGLAEYLAYGVILSEGRSVRISGQDCRRGTFAHRHAAVVDQETEENYFPLSHLSQDQGKLYVYNSLLSEYAVLGFEYGYAQIAKEDLTIWEAQFGDFANGAQIIIDQYICSSEQKWGVRSPVTLMLPHGYEGQGPEHTSARLERFLQLAAQENMRIIMATRPAQVFHALLEQVFSDVKRPLVLFNPKGLLRFTPSLSKLLEFTESGFHKVFGDEPHLAATKVLICSGKVYYDLLSEREKRNLNDVAIIRIEQLYPLDTQGIKEHLMKFNSAKKFVWVQEEHKNMGAYFFVEPHLTQILKERGSLEYAGRDESASPATGSMALHGKEKEQFINQAFN